MFESSGYVARKSHYYGGVCCHVRTEIVARWYKSVCMQRVIYGKLCSEMATLKALLISLVSLYVSSATSIDHCSETQVRYQIDSRF